jgi:hypothetical protein
MQYAVKTSSSVIHRMEGSMSIQGGGLKRPATTWSRSENVFGSVRITPRRQRSLSISLAAEVSRRGSKLRKEIRCKPRRQTKTGLVNVLWGVSIVFGMGHERTADRSSGGDLNWNALDVPAKLICSFPSKHANETDEGREVGSVREEQMAADAGGPDKPAEATRPALALR